MQATNLKTNQTSGSTLLEETHSSSPAKHAVKSADKSHSKESNIVSIQKTNSLTRALEAYGDCV